MLVIPQFCLGEAPVHRKNAVSSAIFDILSSLVTILSALWSLELEKETVVNLLSVMCSFLFWQHFFIRCHTTYICWILVRLSKHLSLTSAQLTAQSGTKARFAM